MRKEPLKGDLKPGLYPELVPPIVPEVRRLILAMAGPEEEREFRLGWSLWRRAHQAIAKRCHAARVAVRRPSGEDRPPSLPASTTILDRRSARLTDEEWARLRALLPDNGHTGG